jgi:hypothetical protein
MAGIAVSPRGGVTTALLLPGIAGQAEVRTNASSPR